MRVRLPAVSCFPEDGAPLQSLVFPAVFIFPEIVTRQTPLPFFSVDFSERERPQILLPGSSPEILGGFLSVSHGKTAAKGAHEWNRFSHSSCSWLIEQS